MFLTLVFRFLIFHIVALYMCFRFYVFLGRFLIDMIIHDCCFYRADSLFLFGDVIQVNTCIFRVVAVSSLPFSISLYTHIQMYVYQHIYIYIYIYIYNFIVLN